MRWLRPKPPRSSLAAMRRPPGVRFQSGLCALLFAFALAGEVYGLHPCADHHPRADEHAGEATHAGHAGGADGSSPENPCCACLGGCHAGAAPPLPASGQLTPRSAVRNTASVRIPSDRALGAPAAYRLPYANAPPSR